MNCTLKSTVHYAMLSWSWTWSQTLSQTCCKNSPQFCTKKSCDQNSIMERGLSSCHAASAIVFFILTVFPSTISCSSSSRLYTPLIHQCVHCRIAISKYLLSFSFISTYSLLLWSTNYCKTLIFRCILILHFWSVENLWHFNFTFWLLTAFCLSIFPDIRCCF